MVGGIFRLSDRKHGSQSNPINSRWMLNPQKPEVLGILAFDTAKSMSRVISLYKSLSNNEMLRLRKQVIRGRGITFLTSNDDGFLLSLACAERLEDLDRAASVVSSLGSKCTDYGLVRFVQVYKDLKNRELDIHKLNNYGSKEINKIIAKMEKLTFLTGELYAELEELIELEIAQKKLNDWKKNKKDKSANYYLFDKKIQNQKKMVRHLKEVSLWNQSYDKIVGLMAIIVCVLYARICTLFRPYISLMRTNNKIVHQELFNDTITTTRSGPICPKKMPLVRFLSMDSSTFKTEDVKFQLGLRHYNNHLVKNKNKVFHAAPPSTVGGSGLATRYANVILLAERYFKSETLIADQARNNLYSLLTLNLKTYVRSKLRVKWKQHEMYVDDEMAQGWRKTVEDILTWLVPVAQDTVTWQAERNMEKQRFDSRPTVLLLQTLHYADLEKTEAALAEVLVGLSCIYLCENRRITF